MNIDRINAVLAHSAFLLRSAELEDMRESEASGDGEAVTEEVELTGLEEALSGVAATVAEKTGLSEDEALERVVAGLGEMADREFAGERPENVTEDSLALWIRQGQAADLISRQVGVQA